jgi:hypothetical protein
MTLYRSDLLEELWPYGYSSIGEVTWQTAAYCARYSIKKVGGSQKDANYRRTDRKTGETYLLETEYVTMSRRPGIGNDWFLRYPGDIYPKDCVHICGRVFKTPRYYDTLYDIQNPTEFKKIKRKRLTAARKNVTENTYSRQRSKRIIAEKNLSKLKREYENEGSTV